MSTQDIRSRIMRLQLEKDQITTQIDAAKRSARSNGEYADHEWLTSAEHAARIKGRQIYALQQELGDAIKADKARRSKSFEQEFINVAREMLPKPLYEQILGATVDRAAP